MQALFLTLGLLATSANAEAEAEADPQFMFNRGQVPNGFVYHYQTYHNTPASTTPLMPATEEEGEPKANLLNPYATGFYNPYAGPYNPYGPYAGSGFGYPYGGHHYRRGGAYHHQMPYNHWGGYPYGGYGYPYGGFGYGYGLPRLAAPPAVTASTADPAPATE